MAMVGDEATVKRLIKRKGSLILQPENPDFAPMTVSEKETSFRILVVENNPFILVLLSDLLPRLGYGVDRAASAAAALEKLGSESFDAVLLDIHLADMDGSRGLINQTPT